MALPAEVKTKTLLISAGTTPDGFPNTLDVTVQVFPHTLTWAATGARVSQELAYVTRVPGEAAVYNLPVTDQAGFVDEFGRPVTDFYFRATVRYMVDRRKSGLTLSKFFKFYESDPETIDFDLAPTTEAPILRGPPGPAGPPGPPGTMEEIAYHVSYVHVQAHPADTWVITHPLSFFPSVSVVDSTGTIVEGDVQYTAPNTVIVSFAGAFSGTVYLS